MKVRLAGDAMVIVEFEQVIDPVVNQRAIDLSGRLRARALPGVRDVVPGYCSVGVHFDPLRTDLARLEAAIEDDARAAEAVTETALTHVHEIPVSYGGANGPDLGAVAEACQCSAAEVVERHAATVYRVYMLGFVPGFAYLGRVDPRITVPRHRVPRGAGARRIRRDCRGADRRLSRRIARWMATHRPHGDPDVRSQSSSRQPARGQARGCGSCPNDVGWRAARRQARSADARCRISGDGDIRPRVCQWPAPWTCVPIGWPTTWQVMLPTRRRSKSR